MVWQERHALFNGIVAITALIVFAALVPVIGESRAQSAFAILALTALGPFLYRRRLGQIMGDERDRAIHLRAIQITFAILWILFVGGMCGLYFLHAGHIGDLLILLVWLGFTALILCHSAVLLVLYRRS